MTITLSDNLTFCIFAVVNVPASKGFNFFFTIFIISYLSDHKNSKIIRVEGKIIAPERLTNFYLLTTDRRLIKKLTRHIV